MDLKKLKKTTQLGNLKLSFLGMDLGIYIYSFYKGRLGKVRCPLLLPIRRKKSDDRGHFSLGGKETTKYHTRQFILTASQLSKS